MEKSPSISTKKSCGAIFRRLHPVCKEPRSFTTYDKQHVDIQLLVTFYNPMNKLDFFLRA
jgi:hypothetical protein